MPIHKKSRELLRTVLLHRPVRNPQVSYTATNISLDYDAAVLGTSRPTNLGKLFVDSLDILRAVTI